VIWLALYLVAGLVTFLPPAHAAMREHEEAGAEWGAAHNLAAVVLVLLWPIGIILSLVRLARR
jgi:hypothetical protein